MAYNVCGKNTEIIVVYFWMASSEIMHDLSGCHYRFWVICADMAAQYTVPDPTTPAKMYMTYQGLASYLSSGGEWIS